MSAAEDTVGFTRIDDKGRFSLSKSMRTALGLGEGSTMAYVKVGEAIMLIPQDKHLADLMEAATQTLERAGISVQDMLDDLPEARAAVVEEHYGRAFLDELKSMREPQDAPTGVS